MGLTRVELENFTAFRSLKLDLCPGINVLVGANGTGKTHYADVHQIMPMSSLILNGGPLPATGVRRWRRSPGG